MKNKITSRPTERMHNNAFIFMTWIFKIMDFFFPYIDKRIRKFNIKKGDIVVDYGCGPGRYSIRFSALVGAEGKVYAVDIHELAIKEVYKKIEKNNLKNIDPIHAKGHDSGNYDCGLPEKIADMVCALDMFFVIKEPALFLAEINRILKDSGIFILDDGHQSRQKTKNKLHDSGLFQIIEETKDHIKLKKKL
ncbi:class I SAM-dependent methyltransferase [Bacteroidota bacterium]